MKINQQWGNHGAFQWGTKSLVSSLCCDAYYLLLIYKKYIGESKYHLLIVTEFLSCGGYEAVHIIPSAQPRIKRINAKYFAFGIDKTLG